MTGTAIEIAAAVRAGTRTARQVVEEHLSAIAAGDPDVHAFNLVLADEARQAADGIDLAVGKGEDPGPLAGVPVALEGQHVHAGHPDDVQQQDPRRLASAV